MNSQKCTIVSESGWQIQCNYYEIEQISKMIIQKEVQAKPILENQFLQFAKNYTYFTPYFDFLLTKLNYVILNPLELKGAILYGKQDYILLHFLDNDLEMFTVSDDIHIQLEKATEFNLDTSMMDKNLWTIKSNKGHMYISRHILHTYFIKERDLYFHFLEECQNTGNNFLNFEFSDFLLFQKAFLRIGKVKKSKKTQNLAIFRNRDLFYQIQGYYENITENQKQFVENLIVKDIVSKENVLLSEKENRRVL